MTGKEIVRPTMEEAEKPIDCNQVYQEIIDQIPDNRALMLTFPNEMERYYGIIRLAAASRRGHYGRQGVRTRKVGTTQLLVWHRYGKRIETLVREFRETYGRAAEGAM